MLSRYLFADWLPTCVVEDSHSMYVVEDRLSRYVVKDRLSRYYSEVVVVKYVLVGGR